MNRYVYVRGCRSYQAAADRLESEMAEGNVSSGEFPRIEPDTDRRDGSFVITLRRN